MSDHAPEAVSPTSLPPMTAEQLEARIAHRRREMQEQPCYRCDHSLARPDVDCVCCRSAHTPNADGEFDAVP